VTRAGRNLVLIVLARPVKPADAADLLHVAPEKAA